MAYEVGARVIVVRLTFDGDVFTIASSKCAQWGILGIRYSFLGRITKVRTLPKSRYSRAIKSLLKKGFQKEPIPEYTVEWTCPYCKQPMSEKYSHPELRLIEAV